MYSHAVRKRAAPGDFRVQSDFGGTAVAEDPPSRLRIAAEAVLAHLTEPPVFARVDMLEWHGRWLLMELELIEPELFLAQAPGSAARFARAIQSSFG